MSKTHISDTNSPEGVSLPPIFYADGRPHHVTSSAPGSGQKPTKVNLPPLSGLGLLPTEGENTISGELRNQSTGEQPIRTLQTQNTRTANHIYSPDPGGKTSVVSNAIRPASGHPEVPPFHTPATAPVAVDSYPMYTMYTPAQPCFSRPDRTTPEQDRFAQPPEAMDSSHACFSTTEAETSSGRGRYNSSIELNELGRGAHPSNVRYPTGSGGCCALPRSCQPESTMDQMVHPLQRPIDRGGVPADDLGHRVQSAAAGQGVSYSLLKIQNPTFGKFDIRVGKVYSCKWSENEVCPVVTVPISSKPWANWKRPVLDIAGKSGFTDCPTFENVKHCFELDHNGRLLGWKPEYKQGGPKSGDRPWAVIFIRGTKWDREDIDSKRWVSRADLRVYDSKEVGVCSEGVDDFKKKMLEADSNKK